MQALILNQNYEAMSVIDTNKAFLLVYLQKAEVVESHQAMYLHTVSDQYPMPSVIRLRRYIAMPYRKVLLSRKNILKRDNHRCQYCGKVGSDLTIDHVIPKSLGGADTWENLITACTKCNNKKGNRTPEQAAMPLRSKPFKPMHVLFLRQTMNTVIDNWKPYLFMK